MKKIKPILFAITSAMILVLFTDCNKSGTASPNSFTWTFGGTTYAATLDTAFVNRPIIPYYILAITGTNFNTNYNQWVGFGLSSFNTGAFNIGPGGNSLQFIDATGADHSGLSGTLTITSNANNRLTGNFSDIVSGPSGTVPFTGSFANVPVK